MGDRVVQVLLFEVQGILGLIKKNAGTEQPLILLAMNRRFTAQGDLGQFQPLSDQPAEETMLIRLRK